MRILIGFDLDRMSDKKNSNRFDDCESELADKLKLIGQAARASRTISTYCLARSVITLACPSRIAFKSTRSAPTPSALAPALMKSAAVFSETPPVGTNSICGSGAFNALR